MADDDRAWQHPWLRVERATRAIIAARMTHGATATSDRAVAAIIAERENIERAGWFN
jgi:hypothetical protein